MAPLTWDQVGERTYEHGVDRGVLYLPDTTGDYIEGFAWNGLTTVTESPSGAESNPTYADNIKYLNLISLEEFGATVEAYTYPDEFAQCDGTAEPEPGIYLGQQGRRAFGLRTGPGSATTPMDGRTTATRSISCTALSPSRRRRRTPRSTTRPRRSRSRGRSHDPCAPSLATSRRRCSRSTRPRWIRRSWPPSRTILYGTVGDDPRLPLPDEVITLVGTGVTNVDVNLAANQPTFNNGTGVITLPAVTGVQWKVNGVNRPPVRSPQSRSVPRPMSRQPRPTTPTTSSATTTGRSSGSSNPVARCLRS
jgi:hypothetical protein